MSMRAIVIWVFLAITILIFAGCSWAAQEETPVLQSLPAATAVSNEMAVAEVVAFEAEAPLEAMPSMPEPSGEFNTEEYDRIYENEFLEALSNPLSTVSIDVDTASYSNARRFINDSRLPPQDAVRIEEFINYFNYDYAQPEDEHPFSINVEVSEAPWSPDHQLVHIGLQGLDVPKEELPDSNMVFLLDVSGSMNEPNKLPLVKRGFKLLVEQMSERDSVAIVVYAGAAGLVLPPTNGDNKAAILEAIENLEAGGSTAGGEGIELAYQVARENFVQGGNNRVILATDGDFNVGPSSDGELVRLIEEKRDEGIFLSILGFGTGNLKDSKMEQLADKGNGNYAYLDSIREANKVLVSEMAGTLLTIAKDVKIQIEFNPAKVKAYRLIGYENRLLAKEDFADDTKDAGELGAGTAVTFLYEIIPVGADEAVRPTPELKYQDSEVSDEAEQSNELLTLKLRYKQPDGNESILMVHPVLDEAVTRDRTSDNYRFSAAVAEFGMLLRDSSFKGDASYTEVLALAKDAIGEDEAGYRMEFVHLVETAELLDN
ncbi:MAG: VWA domain-containing protein [Anaerolineaceae bacterium]|nr:MAG: VWA domain-containing protein [Anaerolineaceae bacterium]